MLLRVVINVFSVPDPPDSDLSAVDFFNPVCRKLVCMVRIEQSVDLLLYIRYLRVAVAHHVRQLLDRGRDPVETIQEFFLRRYGVAVAPVILSAAGERDTAKLADDDRLSLVFVALSH